MGAKIIKILQRLYDMAIVGYWAIYDVILTIKCKLCGENYVGVYVKIMSPSERRFHFSENIVTGGLSFVGCVIKLFADKKAVIDEDSFVDILLHETLHQVLAKISQDARIKLDNIQKPFSMLNCETGKWLFYVKFVFLKDTEVHRF